MFTLLIVEDERWEREGLVSLIDRARFSIDRVLTANDGVEGLALIRSHRPDIIITDIRMPGLTGLDMLDEADELLAGSVCIILSGYGEFGYAQKALRIGAADFLVKPIDVAELETVLDRAVRTLNRPGRADSRQPDIRKLLTSSLSVQELCTALNVPDTAGLRLAALAQGTPADGLPPFHTVHDGCILCILRPQDRLPETGLAAGIARLENAADMPAAADRAHAALENAQFRGLTVPLVYASMQRESLDKNLHRLAERMKLEQAVASLDEAQLNDVLDTVSARMLHDLSIDRKAALHELAALSDSILKDPTAELNCASTLEDMLQTLRAMMSGHVHSMRKSLSESESYVLYRVITLVSEGYANADLNLQSIAGQVFLSPNYVGALFKRSTGMTFSDYLCRHRLIAAAELLNTQGMRVSAVAEAVGIPNVSYFCVQFRNTYGITPGNYRKKQ